MHRIRYRANEASILNVYYYCCCSSCNIYIYILYKIVFGVVVGVVLLLLVGLYVLRSLQLNEAVK